MKCNWQKCACLKINKKNTRKNGNGSGGGDDSDNGGGDEGDDQVVVMVATTVVKRWCQESTSSERDNEIISKKKKTRTQMVLICKWYFTDQKISKLFFFINFISLCHFCLSNTNIVLKPLRVHLAMLLIKMCDIYFRWIKIKN